MLVIHDIGRTNLFKMQEVPTNLSGKDEWPSTEMYKGYEHHQIHKKAIKFIGDGQRI